MSRAPASKTSIPIINMASTSLPVKARLVIPDSRACPTLSAAKPVNAGFPLPTNAGDPAAGAIAFAVTSCGLAGPDPFPFADEFPNTGPGEAMASGTELLLVIGPTVLAEPLPAGGVQLAEPPTEFPQTVAGAVIGADTVVPLVVPELLPPVGGVQLAEPPTEFPQTVAGAVTGADAIVGLPAAELLLLLPEFAGLQLAEAFPPMPTEFPHAVTGAVVGAITPLPDADELEPAGADDDEFAVPNTATELPEAVTGAVIGVCAPDPDVDVLVPDGLDPAGELALVPTATVLLLAVTGALAGACALDPDELGPTGVADVVIGAGVNVCAGVATVLLVMVTGALIGALAVTGAVTAN